MSITGGFIMSVSVEAERGQYISKLRSQVSGMEALLDQKFHDVIYGAKHDEIEKLKKKAEGLQRKLEKEEFEVAIIGLEKAGKSTFANAMMGIDILPSKDERCTYTSTSIRYGEADKAIVTFYTREEFLRKFVDNLKTMGIERAGHLDYTTLSLTEYQEYFERLPEANKNYYRASVNGDVETILEHKETLMRFIGAPERNFRGVEELESEELKNYIQNPAYAVAVKEITIYSSRLEQMKNAIFYDVPGFDSPTQIHREQTKERMATADVIIMLVNAGNPSVTGPQIQIFEDGVDRDGIPFNEKIFVFGNKADTANDAIETNISVLKRELDKHRIVKHELIGSRLVIGSARARLEADGKLERTNVSAALASKGLDDGIDRIRTLLETYNRTERFETLKKRVNRIYAELEECLAPELEELSRFSDGSFDYGKIAGIFSLLLDSSRNQIKAELEALKSGIPKEFKKPRPLAAKFIEKLQEISSDRYGVTDEEFRAAEDGSGTGDENITVDSFENALRKKKYDQLYNYFISTIVSLVSTTHQEYDDKICDIFLKALKLTDSHLYYDELMTQIRAYLDGINAEGKEGYYRSLAERFITDLFEVLIRPNFGGRDRWTAYEARKLNLYSLSIFHNKKDKLLPPDRQPMLFNILFHDTMNITSSASLTDALVEHILTYMPGQDKQATNRLRSLVDKVVQEKQDEAEAFIEKICKRCADRARLTSEPFVDILQSRLMAEFVDETSSYDHSDSIVPEITKEYYDKRCKDEELSSSHTEAVRAHLHADIDILAELLKDAAVPAIQIDNAFVSYEVRSIENILNSIDPQNEQGAYRKFIDRNIDKIAYGQLAEFNAEQNKRELYRQICREIQKILGDLKNYEA